MVGFGDDAGCRYRCRRVLGTLGYMAPEQLRGQAVDARADLFAFGAVLYEMLSGRRAFQKSTAADTMTAILTEEPPDILAARPSVPAAVDRIIRHCLEKNPGERFQSARDIAFALDSLTGPHSRFGVASRRDTCVDATTVGHAGGSRRARRAFCGIRRRARTGSSA